MVAKRDPERMAEMWRRLDWFCNELITLPVLAYPKMRDWTGNRVIDGTAFSVFSRKGHNRNSPFRSSYADGAWYLRTANWKIPGTNKKKVIKAFFGFEIHLIVATSNTGNMYEDLFPHLYIGISFGRPAESPSHLGLKAIKETHRRFDADHPERKGALIVGDRGYFANSKPENLQVPVRKLGFKIMTDYRNDGLGRKGGNAGSIQVEGDPYCPAMTPDLINATKDVRSKKIDFETWLNRIPSREKYLLHRHALPDENGAVRMSCPALGPNATVTCPWRDHLRKPEWDEIRQKNGKAKAPFPILEDQLPLRRLAICKNTSSVTFPLEADAKYMQAIRFGTKEWKKHYSHNRQMIESANRYVKDDAKEALSSEGRRRARGAAQQYAMVSMLVFAANMRRINNHKFGEPPKPPKSPRRRDATNGHTFNPDIGEGLAPREGDMPGGYLADDIFSGDIQGAAVDWEIIDENPGADHQAEAGDYELPEEEIEADD